MNNSIDKIITAYQEFNGHCDELSQTQSSIMPFLSKDMKVILKKAKANIKFCDKEIAELSEIKKNIEKILDDDSRYNEIYKLYKDKINDDSIKQKLIDKQPTIIDDMEKVFAQSYESINKLRVYLQEVKLKINQLIKLREELVKTEHNRLERKRKIVYFIIILSLSFFQCIFVFKECALWLKILDGALMILLIIYFIFILIKINKSNKANKRYQQFVVLCNLLTSLEIIVFSNLIIIDGVDRISLIFCLYFLITIEYQLVDIFLITKLFTSELFFRLIVLLSVCGFLINLFTTNLFVLKFSIACIYILIILTTVNFIFYKKEPFFNKKFRNTLMYKFLLIIIYGAGIFLFPYYVNWCGLNGNNFEIFITVYSCVIGGLLTLGGVAWTIKQGDKQRQEDKMLEYRPLFYPIILNKKQLAQSNLLEICFVNDLIKYSNTVIMGAIENSDNAIIVIEKLIINDEIYKPANHSIISKSKRYKLLVNTNRTLINDNIKLVVKDILNNEYCYKMKVYDVSKNSKTKNILSIEEETKED